MNPERLAQESAQRDLVLRRGELSDAGVHEAVIPGIDDAKGKRVWELLLALFYLPAGSRLGGKGVGVEGIEARGVYAGIGHGLEGRGGEELLERGLGENDLIAR